MKLISNLKSLHDGVFHRIEKLSEGWLLEALARLTFVAVLFLYFWNSGKTKIGEGLFGIFNIQDSAYFQILGETGMIAYEFDTANIPWYIDLVVFMGTVAEFALPLMILFGLFTRIAAAGMAIFIFVQSYVDIYVHNVDAGTVGQLFDRDAASLVFDQRALWLFLMAVLIIKGAGALSIDRLLSNWWSAK